VILIGIVIVLFYGLRQSELVAIHEENQKQDLIEATERNRLEIEKNKAEAALEISRLKEQASALIANQAQNNLRDVRLALQLVNRERVKEQKEHDKKLQVLIVTNLDACKRWLKNCQEATRLGLRPRESPCACN
jgi:hypothetical protein